MNALWNLITLLVDTIVKIANERIIPAKSMVTN